MLPLTNKPVKGLRADATWLIRQITLKVAGVQRKNIPAELYNPSDKIACKKKCVFQVDVISG